MCLRPIPSGHAPVPSQGGGAIMDWQVRDASQSESFVHAIGPFDGATGIATGCAGAVITGAAGGASTIEADFAGVGVPQANKTTETR